MPYRLTAYKPTWSPIARRPLTFVSSSVTHNESRSSRDAFARALLKAERERSPRADLQFAPGQPGHRPAGTKTGLRGARCTGGWGTRVVPRQVTVPGSAAGVEAGWRQSRRTAKPRRSAGRRAHPAGCASAPEHRQAATFVGVARTTDGAPFGAPPPLGFFPGGKNLRVVVCKTRARGASREGFCFSALA
jgi:hypothetical protein